jgi:hypothetical protein
MRKTTNNFLQNSHFPSRGLNLGILNSKECHTQYGGNSLFCSTECNIGCFTRGGTRHFVNNSDTNKDIATKFGVDLPQFM